MDKVYLVSADFVRSLTNISNNTQDKFLKSAIRESQDIDLSEVLGTRLTNKLCDLVKSGEILREENQDYKDLLDNCQYFLAYSTVAKLCVITSVKIDNVGVNTTNDENVTQMQLNDVFKIEKHYINKADFYKRRLQNYVMENYKKFDEIKNNSKYEQQPTLHSSASCPIFLGGARGKITRLNTTIYETI